MTLSEYQAAERLTLTKLAERLGRPVSTVHGWIRGHRRPDWDALEHIHEVTGGQVTPTDFLRHPALSPPSEGVA